MEYLKIAKYVSLFCTVFLLFIIFLFIYDERVEMQRMMVSGERCCAEGWQDVFRKNFSVNLSRDALFFPTLVESARSLQCSSGKVYLQWILSPSFDIFFVFLLSLHLLLFLRFLLFVFLRSQ